MSNITLKCRIIEEKDFCITVRLQESGMILDFMKKDIIQNDKEKEKNNEY